MTLRLFIAIFLGLAAPLGAQESTPLVDTPKEQAGTTPAPSISLETDDRVIGARLKGLYGELDGLEQVRPTVRSGVVTLDGKVLTADERKQAETIATRLAGVVSVENRIEIERDVRKRLQPLFSQGQEIVDETLAFLPLLAIALIVFGFFWLAGLLLTRKSPLFAKIAPNPLVRTLLAQITHLAFILVGLVLAMRLLGATALLGSVLGAAGVFGLAVGFAIRDTIENYIASVLLSIRRPFAPNDLVVIEGLEGHVTRLNSRATFLTSLAGNELRIPNAIVYKAKIENFSTIPERRFEFIVGIGYENDLCTAMRVAHDALIDTSGVLCEPEPMVLVDALGDSTIALKALGWVDQRNSDFGKVKSAAMRSVKEAFTQRSISMPEPIQNVRILGETSDVSGHRESAAQNDQQQMDVSPDRTIESKVSELRSESGEDLLSKDAPRE